MALWELDGGEANEEATADGAIDHYDGGCFAPLRAAAGSTDGLENVVSFLYKPDAPVAPVATSPGGAG